MSELKDKKPTTDNKKEKDNKPTRDKNGRFSSDKKSEDGTVKIKIIKEDKKPESPKSKDGEGKESPEVKAYILRFSDEIPFPKFPEFPKFPSLHRLLDCLWKKEESIQEPKVPTVQDLAQYVSEKNPDSMTFNDQKYYSEQFVSKVVAATIAQCAQKSAQEEERTKKVAEEQNRIEEANAELRKKVRNHYIAVKLSKLFASFLLSIGIFGLGCAAVFGLIQFGKFIIK